MSSPSAPHDPIVNINQLEFTRDLRHGDKFDAKLAPVSPRLGAKKLGYNVTQVAPGKRAFPFHCHHANEELFFILEGEGTLRFGARTMPVKQGDFIGCPPGGPELAHQLINTGTRELRYLAVSTMIDTDIFQYPDSGKFGAVGGRPAGSRPQDATFAGFYAEKARLDYWDGE
jgi:uncharacterized cupin superfamily protein